MVVTTISIRECELTDGSVVYDVIVNGMIFPAITRDDAEQLADKLAEAIAAHTNEIVTRDTFVS